MADIAATVVEELSDEESHPETEASVFQSRKTEHPLVGDNEVSDEDEFEFAFVTVRSPIPADEIFSNGRFKPVHPVFNRDSLLGSTGDNVGVKIDGNDSNPKKSGRMPLRKLMSEERETTTFHSNTEDVTVPSGTYCVWEPKKVLEGGRSSSKRWKLRDLLHRKAGARTTGRKLPGRRRPQK